MSPEPKPGEVPPYGINQQRIFDALEEDPILYDEVERIWYEDSCWWVSIKSGAKKFVFAVAERVPGEFTFFEAETNEMRRHREESPEAQAKRQAEIAAIMEKWRQREGALDDDELGAETNGHEVIAVDVSISQMMGTEIQQALGEEPTPESCEAAGAMLTAARDYLLAQRRARFGRRSSDSTHENLKRLVQVFGSGTEDNDPAP